MYVGYALLAVSVTLALAATASMVNETSRNKPHSHPYTAILHMTGVVVLVLGVVVGALNLPSP
jgi:hypothetical protein